MDPDKRRFFVIGYPRSRTAWLSVLLDGDGVRCEHEASGGYGVDGIQRAFDAWDENIVGTCEAALMVHVAELIDLYPDAHWVMIHRDPREALAAMMADRPIEAPAWLERWPVLEAAFKNAERLMSGADCLHVDYRDISLRAREIYRQCIRFKEPDAQKLESLKGLRITQMRKFTPWITEDVKRSAVERLDDLGFDLSGLTVRHFNPGRDSLNFAEWAGREHGAGAQLLPLLPPLGVVVEDESGPAAMIFCRECYGVPAADLEFSVARPGLSLKQTSAAMAFAVAACIELAGKLVVPQAEYSVFRATCRPSLGRFMRRLGFVPHGPDTCQKFIYQKT